MRRLFIALALTGLASAAAAADFELPDAPILRGSSPVIQTPYVPAPPTFTRWTGFYAGGQAGVGLSHVDLSREVAWGPTSPFVAPLGLASAWAEFGKDSSQRAVYGGFIGYNTQWEEIILGFELNYNHGSVSGASMATRSFSSVVLPAGGANIYDATVLATASMKIADYGTLRFRAGWAYENFLPYAMIGLAAGQGQTTRVTTTSGTPTPSSPGGAAFVLTDSASTAPILWGYSAGVGLDVLLSSTVFLRAEYEFIQFFNAPNLRPSVGAIRAGAGFRF